MPAMDVWVGKVKEEEEEKVPYHINFRFPSGLACFPTSAVLSEYLTRERCTTGELSTKIQISFILNIIGPHPRTARRTDVMLQIRCTVDVVYDAFGFSH